MCFGVHYPPAFRPQEMFIRFVSFGRVCLCAINNVEIKSNWRGWNNVIRVDASIRRNLCVENSAQSGGTQCGIKQKRCSSHSLTSHYYQLLRKIKIATLCLSCCRCESKNETDERTVRKALIRSKTHRFRPFFIWTLTFHSLLRLNEFRLSYGKTFCMYVCLVFTLYR